MNAFSLYVSTKAIILRKSAEMGRYVLELQAQKQYSGVSFTIYQEKPGNLFYGEEENGVIR